MGERGEENEDSVGWDVVMMVPCWSGVELGEVMVSVCDMSRVCWTTTLDRWPWGEVDLKS